MTLQNLIKIADSNITIALIGKTDKNALYRYNFAKQEWDEETILTDEKITTIKKFKNSMLYQSYRNNKLVSWSTIQPENCKHLKPSDKDQERKFYRNLILSIGIEIKFHESSTTIEKASSKLKR